MIKTSSFDDAHCMGFVSFDKEDVVSQVLMTTDLLKATMKIINEISKVSSDVYVTMLKDNKFGNCIVFGSKNMGVIVAGRENYD